MTISFHDEDRQNKLQTLVTSIDENHEGSLKIHQDAIISRIDLDKGKTFEYTLKSDNHGVYVMTVFGQVSIADVTLGTRDALGVSNAVGFSIDAMEGSSLLFIEVPMG